MIKTEAKVGLFVLIALLLLFYMTFKISGVRKVKGEGKVYYAKFEDVSGLVEKAKVEIAGVNSGFVDKIMLDSDGKAKIKIILTKNISLKKDAQALIRSYGFMGEKFVEIKIGKKQEILPESSIIVKCYSEKSIGEVANKISEAADEFRSLMKTINLTVGGGEGKNRIENILNNFEEFSKNLNDILKADKEKISKIIDNLNLFSESLAKSSKKFDSVFINADKTFANFAKISDKIASGKGTLGKIINDKNLYKNIDKTFMNIKIISDKLVNGKGFFGKLINDETIYEDFKITMANLKDVTGKIKEGKGTLGKIINEDQMYDDIRKTMIRIQQAADSFSEQTPITTLGVVMGTLF